MPRMSNRLGLLCAFLLVAGASAACEAGNTTTDNNGGADNNGGSGAGGRENDGGNGANNSEGGGGGTPVFSGGGGTGGGDGGGPPINPCGTGCIDEELCDGVNKGLDDDCDGEVDEGCACKAGQISSCFKGDPSYLSTPGCFAGSMKCSEQGDWGFCQGGTHAVSPDNCQDGESQGCHPISALPFQTIDLADGAGNFDDNGTNHTFAVACPQGVDPCPTPTGTSYTPLQSGEYTVTVTKTVNDMEETCTFPLYVGDKGLRVELSWNYQDENSFTCGPDSDEGCQIDLDLHVHKPNNTQPWSPWGDDEHDCGFANCTADAWDPFFPSDTAPEWFPAGNAPPMASNWSPESPNPAENTCYNAPRGNGEYWQDIGMGCHNPRLDLDNISCDPSLTDSSDSSFCAPENINVDYPPGGQWIRVGVHYYEGEFTTQPGWSSFQGNVTPVVKIFCNGALAAVIGEDGFGDGTQPMVLTNTDKGKMWVVADVLFDEDACVSQCVVEAIKGANNAPVVQTQNTFSSSFMPAYPQIP